MWWHAELRVEGRVIDSALEQVVLKKFVSLAPGLIQPSQCKKKCLNIQSFHFFFFVLQHTVNEFSTYSTLS